MFAVFIVVVVVLVKVFVVFEDVLVSVLVGDGTGEREGCWDT